MNYESMIERYQRSWCSKPTSKISYESYSASKRTKKYDIIKNVIFNDPATIVFWSDGTKTVVKAENETFDPEKGLAMAIAKKFFGNKGNYYNIFRKWLPKEENDSVLDDFIKAIDNLQKCILKGENDV